MILGRKRSQSPLKRTSASAPSTSILRKSIEAGACSAHSAASVVAGTVIALALFAELRQRRIGVVGDRGREAVELVDDVERRLALFGADHRLKHPVARTHGPPKARKRRVGLDRDAAPALQIERERDVVENRMAGADVDVEPIGAIAEAPHQIEVFEALRIGDERTCARHRATATPLPVPPPRASRMFPICATLKWPNAGTPAFGWGREREAVPT